MKRLWASLLLAGCATTGGALREAQRCDSFAEFDARTREQLDALLADAPGEVLVKEASRLNLARRTCAKHTLTELRARREADGIEAVQRELDAMTATYRREDLRALMVDALGAEVAQLEPLLEEARQRTTREAGASHAGQRDDAELGKLQVDAPTSMGPEPELPATMCDEPTPCAQLRCVQEADPGEDGKHLQRPARACLDSLATLEPHARANAVSEVLLGLPTAPSPTRTEAMTTLETLRRQLWPEVEAAVSGKQPGHAAQLANVLRGLPSLHARVEALRDAAQAHHLARAKALEKFPDAAWLQRRLAQDFGGPEAPALGSEGTWANHRWRCEGELPELPPLPAGLSGSVMARCEKAPTPRADQPGESLRTFDLEKEMRGQRVLGTVNLACADRTNSFALSADDVASVPHEVARMVDLAVGACTRIHGFAATRSCTELSSKGPGELITRFVGHARFTHRWEPCFVEWLLATEGTAPPAVP